ncbi:MAG: hypothetical protein H8E48_04165 [Chloroflexi bacterium]|nr:hypothetical protein [Chloroflexota bacterium]
MIPEDLVGRIKLLRQSWDTTLSSVEQSPRRIISLEESYKKIGELSLKQDDLFRQAFRCVENQLYRAAHVMGWAAFIDFFHNKLAEDSLLKMRSAMPNWKISVAEDLREYADFQVIEASRKMNYLKKNEQKALHGLLNKRNECGHPEDYYPGLNETLGFLSELLSRIKALKDRPL